jgi:hypothetical protein
MSPSTCPRGIGLDALLDYWLDRAGDEAAQAMDLHLLACDACGARIDAFITLGDGVRRAFDAGLVRAVVDADFPRRLAERGLRLREYRVERNGSVACSVAPDDDVVISRLIAPLEGVARVDLLRDGTHGLPAMRVTDIPFDAASGEICLVMPAAHLRALPACIDRVQIVAVDAAGERLIGEYAFHHRPAA